MNPTPHTDAWKARVREALAPHGLRSELARYLAGGDPEQFEWRKVQISKVLNSRRQPESEFLLAVDAWLALAKRKRRTE